MARPFRTAKLFTISRDGTTKNNKAARGRLVVWLLLCREILERAKGFEPSTPTLARSCSTTELHPHPRGWRRWFAVNGQSYAKCRPRMQQPACAARNRPDCRFIGAIAGESARKPGGRVPAIA